MGAPEVPCKISTIKLTDHKETVVVPTSYYLILSGLIFTIGAIGVLTRRSSLILLMCVELMLNSVNLTLVALSRQWDNVNGQIFVFIIMAVAATEVAVGLAIVIANSRHNDTTNVDDVKLLKW
jgi:NADH-quinone oxidoreductase subunit K